MNKQKDNWMRNPSKKQLVLFSLLWFTGIALLVFAMTDLFTESIFNSKYLLLYFMMAGSTIATANLYLNYFKLKKHENE